MKLFTNIVRYEYKIQCVIPTTYGELVLSKYERDGYDCVVVYATEKYTARPAVLRLENNNILWGAFDCTNEKIEEMVDGHIYHRYQTVKTEWFPLTVPQDLQENVLLPAIKLLLEE